MKRSSRLIGAFGAAAVAAGVIAAGAPASSAAGTTTITLKVTGCEGCEFTPNSVWQKKMGAMPSREWKGDTVTVRNGVAKFKIPTDYTRGMSLEVDAPWQRGSSGAVTMAALSKDSFCWAGTKKSSATLKMIVKKAQVEGMGEMATVPMAYLAKVGAPKQIPGHQDLPYCRG